MPNTLGIIGTGYVGLVTGTCFAETGNQTICVDIDPKKIEMLASGRVPIYEPGLEMLLERNIRERRISFTLDLKDTVLKSEVIFLCLPTPPGEDGSADLSYILDVARRIGEILTEHPESGYKVIVDKSTVPVGTNELVHGAIHAGAPDADFDVVSNPEFLREGFAVEDFMRPERVVIGTGSARAEKIMRELYDPFVRSGNPIYFVSERSAEIAKYAANAFVAMRISFINDMAAFCERAGADIDEIRAVLGSDSRIGKRYLFPSIGYGGSCFPKDVKAILKTASDLGMDLEIVSAVENINKRQPARFFEKIRSRFGGNLSGRRFAVWGLAFKANTDDVRESPSFAVIDQLLAAGARVTAYDPEAMEGTRRQYGDRIVYGEGMYEALRDADALVIATEWNEFRNPNFGRMIESMRAPLIFDGRNLFELEAMAQKGFEYHSIGRVPVGRHGGDAGT